MRLNCNQHCNVLFSDNIRNGLVTQGACLTASEQTASIEQDELLHKKICKECNNTNKHNEHGHPQLMSFCKEDPSVFKVPLTWQQFKLELEQLLKQCKHCFDNWKKSGNHGTFNDNKDKKENNQAMPFPFEDFAGTNASLRCLHEFVHQLSNVIEKAIRHLPQGAFQESIGDKESCTTPCPSSLAQKKRMQAVKQENVQMLIKCLNVEKREEALADRLAACLDHRLMIYRRALDKAEDRCMELLREARKRKKLTPGPVNLRFKKHLNCVEEAIRTGVHPKPKMGDDDSDNSSVDSLDSIFVQV